MNQPAQITKVTDAEAAEVAELRDEVANLRAKWEHVERIAWGLNTALSGLDSVARFFDGAEPLEPSRQIIERV